MVPLDASIAYRAARPRCKYRLKLPDAIQLAAALEHGVVALVTHDREFGKAADEVRAWGM